MSLRQNLSRRELEVGHLLTVEKSTSEIAQELHVSEKTVYTHIDHIYDKTGCDDQESLIGWLSSWFK